MQWMEKFEEELEQLRDIAGVDPEKYPLRWLKWETQYRSESGVRAPPWREAEGDLGYIIADTHDNGIIVILCKNDGSCYQIKGYVVNETGAEELCYEPNGSIQTTIRGVLSDASPIFKELIDQALAEPPVNEETLTSRKALDNDLISLPQPVLILTPPQNDNDKEGEEENEVEDDQPIVPYPRAPPNDSEYWNIFQKMKRFASNLTDPLNQDLQDVKNNPNLKETTGQRAILDANALPAMLDVLRIKQAQHATDSHQSQQAEAVVQILSQITVSPNIRRIIATDQNVETLLQILIKEERSLMDGLFTIIANCCKNTQFRELVIKHKGVEPLIYQINQADLAAQVCYVLWTLNRSEHATQMMLKSHLDHELQKFVQKSEKQSEKQNDELMLNITRLLYSVAIYDPQTSQNLTKEQLAFFCQGLTSQNVELVTWSAKAFTVFKISDELQKPFCSANCEGPARLTSTLDNKNDVVVLAGFEAIAVVGTIPKILNEILNTGILSKLQNHWKNENPDIRKGTLRALGVLTKHQKCAQWTVRQNLIPDLIDYLNNTDPDFVIYAAKAIGACCKEKQNLQNLTNLNGIRILWSLMKSPYNGVQAAATSALVPFLQSENSPSVVRTFVDGLDLLVDLLRSNDPDVQASACMAITEVAKDKENLAVMTDLGLVELLSRLLSTKLDSVRKPLADAIGVSADWSNNRRMFGEEGAVDPLVSYLRPPSNNEEVHAATAKALKALSEDTENSKNLRQAGVVNYLLDMVESKDPDLQMAAAVAIRNIRTNCVHVE
ncbi:Armadillo/beta-catenin-like repeat family protein [Tritrichomonas foetus]|uniref:Armadillo/beta-catenin-like repeat family protein n=1 Tax=Tritrichomonas foetus TaxID=1144522 RepID=A0A1J4J166_9EUKA|nr:Armadillo/beta-catenin-like repeat family protein [Tritrichomonas foetus]|eukprot:OHS93162.1 Armadillo/beta-catenin-like repeat family protein [Tritrichomonas foetus]